ncbi:MAG: hypothetical protein AAFU55_11915 [Pseudomonadota bacterium]
MSSPADEIDRAVARRPEGAGRRALEEIARLWREAEGAGDGAGALLRAAPIGAPLADTETDWIWPVAGADVIAPGAISALAPLLAHASADAVVLDDVALDETGGVFRPKPVFDPLLLSATDYVGR